MRLVRGMHGYIYRSLTGWAVCWMWGPESSQYRYRFGFSTWHDALGALKRDWNERD
jgi:hypothetical protein